MTATPARLWPYAVASAAACAVALAVSVFLPNPARMSAMVGVGAAALGAACALAALGAGIGKGVNGVLAAFTVGFLCRGLLVAVGLFASGARGNSALAYVAAFFTLYAATQVIEVLFVKRSSQGATT